MQSSTSFDSGSVPQQKAEFGLFDRTVAAICASILQLHFEEAATDAERLDASNFLLRQCGRMPDFLRSPMRLLTVGFAVWPIPFRGTVFHRLSCVRQAEQLERWGTSRLGVRRDFVRFYETLATFALLESRSRGGAAKDRSAYSG